VACASCGGQTPSGKKFCIHCGSPVQASCPALDAEATRARARLAAHGDSLREEAVSVFEALGAEPWLQRARQLGSSVAA
jgi:hypothetical protein